MPFLPVIDLTEGKGEFALKRRSKAALALLMMLLTASVLRQSAAAADTAERTLIIDAGHGGEDGGAQSESGVLESDVNLEIALRMEALARFCGVPTKMTRVSREIDYPAELGKTAQRKAWDQKQRVALINATPNAVLISIHQNKYPDPRPHGPQILYAEGEDSKALGELAHELLTQSLCPENRRVAAPISREIYLTRAAKCPAILAECGFLSNQTEAALLVQPEYQTKIATVLLCAYLQYFEAGEGS